MDRGLKDCFESIYKINHWGSTESVSRPASDLSKTINLRKMIPKIIKGYDINSILDVPCGDMNWFSQIDIGETKYTGFDIVDEIIANNKKVFGAKNYCFEVKNALMDKLPCVDLILCRDLIIHFPIASIFDLLNNFVESGSKYLLVSQHTIKNNYYAVNSEIDFGQFAFRNLSEPPFTFPEP